MTDLVEAQTMLKKVNQSLEEKVKARTQELENKNSQLSQINFELDNLNRIHRTVGKDIRTLDLEEILQEVEDSVSELIKESKARIQKDLQVNRVYFSHTGLRSVLYNLLSNSLKYRSADRPLDIRITSRDEGEYHAITISDNGIGFDMSKKDVAFSLFKRLHTHVKGSGMGLYMVKRIMKQLDGNVEVESKIDKGTTFYLYLKKSRQ